MHAPRTLLPAVAVAIGLFATPAAAMTFEASSDGSVIRGVGPIETGDAARLREVVTPDYISRYGLRQAPTLSLHSPGGGVIAGVELANTVRTLGLSTHVDAQSGCYSACTFVVLGGLKRTVEGKYGIHAMAKGGPGRIAVYSDRDFDEVQALTSTLINMAQSLVGDSRIIAAMLTVRNAEIRVVPDNFLAEWRVITHALRPAQRMVASFDCNQNGLQEVERQVCDQLVLAEADRRVAAAYETLIKTRAVEGLAAEHARWRAYLASCRNVPGPDRSGNMQSCIRQAYEIRMRQLEGLTTFHEASARAPASSQWKELPPLEEINVFRQEAR